MIGRKEKEETAKECKRPGRLSGRRSGHAPPLTSVGTPYRKKKREANSFPIPIGRRRRLQSRGAPECSPQTFVVGEQQKASAGSPKCRQQRTGTPRRRAAVSRELGIIFKKIPDVAVAYCKEEKPKVVRRAFVWRCLWCPGGALGLTRESLAGSILRSARQRCSTSRWRRGCRSATPAANTLP